MADTEIPGAVRDLSRPAFARLALFPVVLVITLYPFSVLALMYLYVLWRDEIWQPQNAAKWRIGALLKSLPWWGWLILLVLFVLILLEGVFRLYRKQYRHFNTVIATKQSLIFLDAETLADINQRHAEAIERVEQFHEIQRASSRGQIESLTARISSLEGQPDVTLQVSSIADFNGKATGQWRFQLHSHRNPAIEVRIEPFSVYKEQSSTKEVNGQTITTETPRMELMFPAVTDIGADDSVDVQPVWNLHAFGLTQEIENRLGYSFEKAIEKRNELLIARAVDEMDGGPVVVEPTLALAREPLRIQSRVTYWNSSKTRKWRRPETLVYDSYLKTFSIEHGTLENVKL
jgi:hypothetical protein